VAAAKQARRPDVGFRTVIGKVRFAPFWNDPEKLRDCGKKPSIMSAEPWPKTPD